MFHSIIRQSKNFYFYPRFQGQKRLFMHPCYEKIRKILKTVKKLVKFNFWMTRTNNTHLAPVTPNNFVKKLLRKSDNEKFFTK